MPWLHDVVLILGGIVALALLFPIVNARVAALVAGSAIVVGLARPRPTPDRASTARWRSRRRARVVPASDLAPAVARPAGSVAGARAGVRVMAVVASAASSAAPQ
jgi:hypothetical protein